MLILGLPLGAWLLIALALGGCLFLMFWKE